VLHPVGTLFQPGDSGPAARIIIGESAQLQADEPVTGRATV
jgi:hypothetical protein